MASTIGGVRTRRSWRLTSGVGLFTGVIATCLRVAAEEERAGFLAANFVGAGLVCETGSGGFGASGSSFGGSGGGGGGGAGVTGFLTTGFFTTGFFTIFLTFFLAGAFFFLAGAFFL